VLAVDDDAMNLDIIAATFEGADIDLKLAESGAQAMAFLEDPSTRFDLVILDRMMPGVDGMGVLHWIRATARLAGIPVIMQTAAAGADQVEEGLRAGAYYYLTKPYAPSALRTIVQAALADTLRAHEFEVHLQARSAVLDLARSAAFRFTTLDDGSELAGLLAALCPDPSAALVGLNELMCNAVEHGNLGISYAEKSSLKRQDSWRQEVDRRAQLPELRDRYVDVSFERRDGVLCFRITDQGLGFSWEQYLTMDAARAFDPNGRGIALARMFSFQDLHYEDGGRTAVATVGLVPRAAGHDVASQTPKTR
jgi:DNA-binding response OmpR family regulator